MSKSGEDDRNNDKVTTSPAKHKVDSLHHEMLMIQPNDSEILNYEEKESELFPVTRE